MPLIHWIIGVLAAFGLMAMLLLSPASERDYTSSSAYAHFEWSVTPTPEPSATPLSTDTATPLPSTNDVFLAESGSGSRQSGQVRANISATSPGGAILLQLSVSDSSTGVLAPPPDDRSNVRCGDPNPLVIEKTGATIHYLFKLNGQFMQDWWYREEVTAVRVRGARSCPVGARIVDSRMARFKDGDSEIWDEIYTSAQPWFAAPCKSQRDQTWWWGATKQIVEHGVGACTYSNTQLIDITGSCDAGGTVTTSAQGSSTSCAFPPQPTSICK